MGTGRRSGCSATPKAALDPQAAPACHVRESSSCCSGAGALCFLLIPRCNVTSSCSHATERPCQCLQETRSAAPLLRAVQSESESSQGSGSCCRAASQRGAVGGVHVRHVLAPSAWGGEGGAGPRVHKVWRELPPAGRAAGPQKTHEQKVLLICTECGQSFSCPSSFMLHQHVHSRETLQKPYVCPQCGRTFSYKTSLGVHLLAHRSERPFMCPSCRKSFKNKTYLVVHQRVHTRVRPYACAECSKSFLQKRDLMVHQRVHSKESPFPCSECGRRFRYKSSLAIHQCTHTGERPFPCPDCSRHFKYKTNLLIHQRMHTGEHPYPCPQCSKSFTCSTNLIMHQITHDRQQEGPRGPPAARRRERKRAHTADQPFVCAECGKGFKKHGFLIIHQRSHCPAPAGVSAEQAAGPGKAPCSSLELAQSRQLGQGRPRAPHRS
ncbi:zinc finger protein 169-like isoform X3 [Gopherus flavomarginatus]|uniref:zinc finger protein 169-like isoform X1 n=1 Tax=Gopherus flavomarginatus TaxID=286002 RepID=UPI0021CBBDF5|nr:zinc finger protein 169-like isoform X1 [Gopherus flavomarginatus]XP_050798659.1 zinc finger protein 169-like isoform X2 [Gopherus flavomarginatus]XP_050798660.1 zinc finger protein 169-like isoform X3 [Gopherus flavomarginatus]